MWISKHNFDWELRQATLKGSLEAHARFEETRREEEQEERLAQLEAAVQELKFKKPIHINNCNCGSTQPHG